MLAREQIEFFSTHGYLVVENAITAPLLGRLRQDFDGWAADSRPHQAADGQTMDSRRFGTVHIDDQVLPARRY